MEKAEYLSKNEIKLEITCNFVFQCEFFLSWHKGCIKKALLIGLLEYVFIQNIYSLWFDLFMKEFILFRSAFV